MNDMYSHTSNNELTDSYNGFIRGNMFNSLYKPYKNHQYKVTPHSEKDQAMLKIQELCFATNDLDLYLDVYNNDSICIDLYNHYMQEVKILTEKYENKYGPLVLNSSALNQYPWAWLNGPWPWEG
jgi:spore coat protein JB